MEEEKIYVDSCYENVEAIIDDAIRNSEFQYTSVDEERLEKLKSLCELIDQMNEEFEIDSYETTVDSEYPGIEVVIECSEIIISNVSHPLYEALKFCERVEVSHGEHEDNLSIRFIFPDLFRT